MRNLVGFFLVILGGVLFALTQFVPSAVVMFIGVFLFASFSGEETFCDYMIANSADKALLRKRYYMDFLPFTFVSTILTLGKAQLRIVWKEEYFMGLLIDEETINVTKISRKEYISLRNEQRRIYSTQLLSKAFMEKCYTVEDIGFKRKKTRLIIASVFACLMLTGLTVPGEIYLVLIYEAIFVPMILLWIPEYKDAKILQCAYERSVGTNNQS